MSELQAAKQRATELRSGKLRPSRLVEHSFQRGSGVIGTYLDEKNFHRAETLVSEPVDALRSTKARIGAEMENERFAPAGMPFSCTPYFDQCKFEGLISLDEHEGLVQAGFKIGTSNFIELQHCGRPYSGSFPGLKPAFREFIPAALQQRASLSFTATPGSRCRAVASPATGKRSAWPADNAVTFLARASRQRQTTTSYRGSGPAATFCL